MNTLDPIALRLGPLQIHWYGICYALAFVWVWWFLQVMVRKRWTSFTVEQLENYLLWFIGAELVGARLLEVLYYNPSYYFANPVKIFAIWEGGLSFHGGLVGVIIAALILTRRQQHSFWHLADVFVLPASLAQAFGRFGNFFNHELFGHVTTAPWGVNFRGEIDATGAFVFRHPSQLYEALYNIVIFMLLFGRQWWYAKKGLSLRAGSQFGSFLILYGTFRFVTEFFRVPDYMIGPLTAGQLLCLPMIMAGFVILIVARKQSTSGQKKEHVELHAAVKK